MSGSPGGFKLPSSTGVGGFYIPGGFNLPTDIGQDGGHQTPYGRLRAGEVNIENAKPLEDKFGWSMTYGASGDQIAQIINNPLGPAFAEGYQAHVDKDSGEVLVFKPDPKTGQYVPGTDVWSSAVKEKGLGAMGRGAARGLQEQALATAGSAAIGGMAFGPPGAIAGTALSLSPFAGVPARAASTAITEEAANAYRMLKGASPTPQSQIAGDVASSAGLDVALGGAGRVAAPVLRAAYRPGAAGFAAAKRGITGAPVPEDLLTRATMPSDFSVGTGAPEPVWKQLMTLSRPGSVDAGTADAYRQAYDDAQKKLDYLRSVYGPDVKVDKWQLLNTANPKSGLLADTFYQTAPGQEELLKGLARNNQDLVDATNNLLKEFGRVDPETQLRLGLPVPMHKVKLWNALSNALGEKRNDLVLNYYRDATKKVLPVDMEIDINANDIISDIEAIRKSHGLREGSSEWNYLDAAINMAKTPEMKKLEAAIAKQENELGDLMAKGVAAKEAAVPQRIDVVSFGPATEEYLKSTTGLAKTKEIADLEKAISDQESELIGLISKGVVAKEAAAPQNIDVVSFGPATKKYGEIPKYGDNLEDPRSASSAERSAARAEQSRMLGERSAKELGRQSKEIESAQMYGVEGRILENSIEKMRERLVGLKKAHEEKLLSLSRTEQSGMLGERSAKELGRQSSEREAAKMYGAEGRIKEHSIAIMKARLAELSRIRSPQQMVDLRFDMEGAVKGFEESGHIDAIKLELAEKMNKRLSDQGFLTEAQRQELSLLNDEKEFLTGRNSPTALFSGKSATELNKVTKWIIEDMSPDEFKVFKSTMEQSNPKVLGAVIADSISEVLRKSKRWAATEAERDFGKDVSSAMKDTMEASRENFAKVAGAEYEKIYPRVMAAAVTPQQKVHAKALMQFFELSRIGKDANSKTAMRTGNADLYGLSTGNMDRVSRWGVLTNPVGELEKTARTYSDKWARTILEKHAGDKRFGEALINGEPNGEFMKMYNLAQKELKSGKNWDAAYRYLYAALSLTGHNVGRGEPNRFSTQEGRHLRAEEEMKAVELRRPPQGWAQKG